MNISDLKQPYRRMAEYLAEKNTKLTYAFDWEETVYSFWSSVNVSNHPLITEEIKQHFPDDFDFSEDKVEDERTYNNKEKYTLIAKEGKFDQLPDTCEFSEPVVLEVWDNDKYKHFRRITGKFKGNYMDIHCIGWKNVQLPTPEIDFSQFNPGDILEITNKDNEKYYGLLHFQNINELFITFGYKSDKVKCILKDNILSISKLK